MTDSVSKPTYSDRIRSWAGAHGRAPRAARRDDTNLLPLSTRPAETVATNPSSNNGTLQNSPSLPLPLARDSAGDHESVAKMETGAFDTAGNGVVAPPVPSAQTTRPGSLVETDKKNVAVRFLETAKIILFHSKLNLLLAFVPIGIVVAEIPGMSPGLIFAMNAIAIIPLAGLLSFATEVVARKLGDSLGALLNITFGNAVELIIL